MTFRGSIPSGQGYGGQPQVPVTEYPEYTNGYIDANPNTHYENQQYVQPGAYTNQPVQHYYSPDPPQQFHPFHGSQIRPPPPPAAPPVEFVNPSFLQQLSVPASTYHLPPPRPMQLPQPVAPGTAQAPAAVPPPATQRVAQPPSVNNSPSLDMSRPPSQEHRMRTAGSSTAPKKQGSAGSVTKSPSVSHASVQLDTLSLLICVAEDCFKKGREHVQAIGKALHPSSVKEYHKLIATGLGCLEMAMQSNKAWPRLEARIRLRYASVLVEETTNYMEAETALLKGIGLCERHRLTDLKYCMQYLQAKVLFQRNPKAAFISIDAQISDSTTYKQVQWMYAFRFLKAAFYIQTGAPADPHALENLRKLSAIGIQRGDKAICVTASLLEGLARLGTMKSDAILSVQTCIARAARYQLEDAARLPQLDILLLLLDLACSLHERTPDLSSQKFVALQKRMEDLKHSHEWDPLATEVVLPIKKQPSSSQSHAVSADTRAILREGDGAVDYLVLPALSHQQALALAFTFQGLVALAKSTTSARSSDIWAEGLKALQDPKSKPPAASLPDAIQRADWETELFCYTNILMGLQAATLSEWAKVKKVLRVVEEAGPRSEVLKILTLYLSGVLQQGVANLDGALRIFESPEFDLESTENRQRGHIQTEVSILAALNRLWIMQHSSKADYKKTADLLDVLHPLCADSPDLEIGAAFNLILATIKTNPPSSINQIKRHIQLALNGAQKTGNTHCLAMALNIMRCRLFENVVGEQALKSAKAGSAQAKKSGNRLWMSVAEGMLAQSFEMQGAIAEARATKGDGIRLANEAFARTKC